MLADGREGATRALELVAFARGGIVGTLARTSPGPEAARADVDRAEVAEIVLVRTLGCRIGFSSVGKVVVLFDIGNGRSAVIHLSIQMFYIMYNKLTRHIIGLVVRARRR